MRMREQRKRNQYNCEMSIVRAATDGWVDDESNKERQNPFVIEIPITDDSIFIILFLFYIIFFDAWYIEKELDNGWDP